MDTRLNQFCNMFAIVADCVPIHQDCSVECYLLLRVAFDVFLQWKYILLKALILSTATGCGEYSVHFDIQELCAVLTCSHNYMF